MKHKVMTTIFTLVLAALAVTLLLQTPAAMAGDQKQQTIDELITVAAGIYQPAADGWSPSNLGLETALPAIVFSKVNIYPVSGLPGDWHSSHAIGTFYLGGGYAVYDLPGGSILAEFVAGANVTRVPPPTPATNGFVSWTLDGTFKLNILEATGIYAPLAHGHIHMVDTLKFIKVGDIQFVGDLLEECFCHFHPEIVAP